MNLSFIPSIDIITGPMYCGKTTETIGKLIVYHEIGMRTLYVNTKMDTRSDNAFSTHNKTVGSVPFDCVKVEDLRECKVENYDVIAIDESQFFDNLKDIVLDWVERQNKIVIISGLSGDFQRNKFGQIVDLFPYADTVTKLSSFCMECKKNENKITPAHFTKRTVHADSKILIGGKESYIPVCRKCFLQK